MNYPETTPARQAAVNGLAAVGFIALVVAGIWLAVYSTRFIPNAVNRIGQAAVYLGSVFTPAPTPSLTVVPSDTASTTINFGEATTSAATSTPAATTTPSTPKPVATTPGSQTNTTVTIGNGSSVAPALYGLSDLSITVKTVGYLTTTSADSFVAARTVPSGNRPAVTFTVKNTGTNATGSWNFRASIPTRRAYTYESPQQQSLLPGESIDYTLGFDQATTGTDQLITLSVNDNRMAVESNYNNNTTSAAVNVQ